MRARWKRSDTARRGIQLAELSAHHWDVLASRFEDGFLERLKADLEALDKAESEAMGSKAKQESLTAEHDKALEFGAKTVVLARALVRARFDPESPMRNRFGVGAKLRADCSRSVSDALNLLLGGIQADPEAARSAGLVADDLQAIQRALDRLKQTDLSQEGQKLQARIAVQERELIQIRVEQAMDKLMLAAKLAFIDQPNVAKLFDIRPLPRGKRRSRPEGEAPAVEVEPKAG
jgi:hypothetical protein